MATKTEVTNRMGRRLAKQIKLASDLKQRLAFEERFGITPWEIRQIRLTRRSRGLQPAVYTSVITTKDGSEYTLPGVNALELLSPELWKSEYSKEPFPAAITVTFTAKEVD